MLRMIPRYLRTIATNRLCVGLRDHGFDVGLRIISLISVASPPGSPDRRLGHHSLRMGLRRGGDVEHDPGARSARGADYRARPGLSHSRTSPARPAASPAPLRGGAEDPGAPAPSASTPTA